MTMDSIHARLVMVGIGVMSIIRDNSFWILTSPFSVLLIRWIVIIPISSAILLQAVMISGFLSRDV